MSREQDPPKGNLKAPTDGRMWQRDALYARSCKLAAWCCPDQMSLSKIIPSCSRLMEILNLHPGVSIDIESVLCIIAAHSRGELQQLGFSSASGSQISCCASRSSSGESAFDRRMLCWHLAVRLAPLYIRGATHGRAFHRAPVAAPAIAGDRACKPDLQLRLFSDTLNYWPNHHV